MRVVVVIGLLAVTTMLVAGRLASARLPAESAGVDQVARALVAAFDQVDVVAPRTKDQGRTKNQAPSTKDDGVCSTIMARL